MIGTRVIANTEGRGRCVPEEKRGAFHYKGTRNAKSRGNACAREVKEMREEGIDSVALPYPSIRPRKSH